MEIRYNPHDSKSVELDLNAIHHLTEIRYWTFVIGVVGLVALATFLIASLTDWAPWVVYLEKIPYAGRCFLISLVLFVMFWPGYFLVRFSLCTRQALSRRDSKQLALSLRYLKKYYRSVAIIVFIVVTLYVFFEVLVIKIT